MERIGHLIFSLCLLQIGNSKQLVEIGHLIIIDRPDVVIDAISQVVRSVRNKTKL